MNDKKEICEICGKHTPSYNSILISQEKGHKLVCLPCYNKDMSEAVGVEYEHVELHPILLKDAVNVEHTFYFAVQLQADNLLIETFELIDNQPAGYKFKIGGNVEDGLFVLFSKLYEKMLKGINKKHIHMSRETGSWQIHRDEDGNDVVRGRITADLESDDSMNTPLIVVDGKEITWKEFGRMLMTFEGGNFKIQMFDPYDEME